MASTPCSTTLMTRGRMARTSESESQRSAKTSSSRTESCVASPTCVDAERTARIYEQIERGTMRKLARRIGLSLVCAVGLLCARPAGAQTVDDALRADIEKLMQVTGAAQIGSQMASAVAGQVLTSLKQAQPDLPDRALTIAREVLDKEFANLFSGPQNILQELVPVYAKYFTQDDIRGMLAF